MNENDRPQVSGWYPAGTAEVDKAAWYAVPKEDAPSAAEEPSPSPSPKKRKTARIAGIVCFALVLLTAAGVTLWRAAGRAARAEMEQVQSPALPPTAAVPDAPEAGEYDDFREYFANYYTGSDDVSIPRTAVGMGVTVELRAASGEPLALQEVYDRVSPAVVGIVATRDGVEYSWGTGVVFREDGYIITNTHIIAGCDGARAFFVGDSEVEYTAFLVGADAASDIAVLKIEGEGFPCAEFGDSDALRVGDEVIAIGNPLGEDFAGTMTNGIVSAINRNVRSNGHSLTLLQTNAALNEGNSGGPLVNAWGQVVGITNMKIMSSYTTTVEGIGFAIPSTVVKEVADQLLEIGDVMGSPTIGITAGPVSAEAMALYDLPSGVYVASVDERSDAARQGLVVGDIILEVNGEPVSSVADVNAIKDEFSVGDPLTLTVFREGETFEMEIRLVDRTELK